MVSGVLFVALLVLLLLGGLLCLLIEEKLHDRVLRQEILNNEPDYPEMYKRD